MSDSRLTFELSRWQKELQLHDYKITCERISIHQVCDDSCKRGHEFVGILADHINCTAYLYHTRKLHMDDIIHELLHVKYPTWTEGQVNRETELILMWKEVNKS